MGGSSYTPRLLAPNRSSLRNSLRNRRSRPFIRALRACQAGQHKFAGCVHQSSLPACLVAPFTASRCSAIRQWPQEVLDGTMASCRECFGAKIMSAALLKPTAAEIAIILLLLRNPKESQLHTGDHAALGDVHLKCFSSHKLHLVCLCGYRQHPNFEVHAFSFVA